MVVGALLLVLVGLWAELWRVPRVDATAALSGGAATVFNTTPNAFGQPAPGLGREEGLLFFVGNSFFNQNWVTAPASTTARDGLGPFFNARSCAGCHFKDGRGRPPVLEGERGTGMLLRLSMPGETPQGAPVVEPTYGEQLQDHAIEGVTEKGELLIEYEEVEGAFADGTPYSLRQPTYQIAGLGYGELHPDTMVSPRVAQTMVGMGLLEAVPEATLLALADPSDADGDGISGRPNYVWDVGAGQRALGRFGWKANQPTVRQQVASAFLGDIGITTRLFPEENCADFQLACLAAARGGAPEIDEDDFEKVVLYASALAVPARRGLDDPLALQGERLFNEAGCVACHVPTLETGTHATIPALSGQTIHPYTDLLLHDMGEGLADGRPDFEATGQEWRTPPLWGIGLVQTVNHHTFLLHDGRARSVSEAILWHGGEAEAARRRFVRMTQAEREALVAFLESL